MRLYFAFSNTMILMQANIQVNLCNEAGDLLVWSTNPIDYRLVEIVRRKSVFRNIWYIEYPKIQAGGKKKIDKYKNYRIKKEYYNEALGRLLYGRLYDEFITAGFWGDTMFVLRYLLKYNPQIKIGISEEGLLNYYAGKGHKNLYYMVQYTKWQCLGAFLRDGRIFRYVQNNIVADYLSSPELLRYENNNSVYKLPAIDDNNFVMKEIVDELCCRYDRDMQDTIMEYQNRNICYIVSPYNKNYDPVNCDNMIMAGILEEVPRNTLVFKTHTNATYFRKNFGKNLKGGEFIDKGVYLFEALYSHMDIDFSKKIFILRNSSIAIYLTQVFKVEPIFIFVHRLYSRYHYRLDDCGDFYVEDLKRNMKHPERILVPNSYVEFKIMLNQLCEGYEEDEEEKPENNEQFKKFMESLFNMVLEQHEQDL